MCIEKILISVGHEQTVMEKFLKSELIHFNGFNQKI